MFSFNRLNFNMDENLKNQDDVNNILPEMDEFSQTREEYIRSLEMSVQLLQREVEHLRAQTQQEDSGGEPAADSQPSLLAGSFLSAINKCASGLEALKVLNDFHTEKFKIMESNIYYLTGEKKLIPVNSPETSSVPLLNTIKSLDETGVIDWAISKGGSSVIPNMSDEPESGTPSIIILPLIIKGNPIGVFLAKSSKEAATYTEEELALLANTADYTAIALDNIKSSEEIANMNKRLNILNNQMARSSGLASVGRMAGLFASEIDNPLQMIKANLGFLESGLGDTRRRIQIIREQVDSIAEIKSRLASISLNPAAESMAAPIRIATLIDDAILFSESQLLRDGIKVEKDIEDDSLETLGFKNQINQALLNVMLFQRDTMPDGGVITIGLFKQGTKKILISFADNGIGLDDNSKKDIFDPFSGDAAGKNFGAGLYNAKNIIEQHKGLISFVSELGKGSTFKIELPLK